jgi:PadR family transcriptional regulator PadR
MFSPELKKGSVELMVLSVIEDEPRHGYEIGKLIEIRSGGQIQFHITSLYPVLYRMENRGWIKGRWVEKEGVRRRCYYRLTKEGEQVLGRERKKWQAFTAAVNEVIGTSHA